LMFFYIVRRIRITQVELKQDVNSLHKKVDLIISKITEDSSVRIQQPQKLNGPPEEFTLPVGEMSSFDELEKLLQCSDAQTKLVLYLRVFWYSFVG